MQSMYGAMSGYLGYGAPDVAAISEQEAQAKAALDSRAEAAEEFAQQQFAVQKTQIEAEADRTL